MNPVIEAILTRHSTRKFKDEPLKKEEVEIILKCAASAPTAMNRQTFQFTALTKKEDINALIDVMAKALNKEDYNLYRPSCVIIVSNIKDYRFMKDDNACALQNIYLASHSLGIGCVWINQLQDVCDDEGVRKLLTEWKIPENHGVSGIAVLGYPDMDVMLKERKAVINIF